MPPDKIEGLTNDRPSPAGTLLPAGNRLGPSSSAWRARRFGLAAFGLVLCFLVPLWNLTRFAATSGLFSYILLIPFISFYLVRQKQKVLLSPFEPARFLTALFLAAGTMVLVGYWVALRPHLKSMEIDYLSVMTLAFLLYFLGVCGWFLGRHFLCANKFALGFLILLVPIPTVAIGGIDSFLQYGSATVARELFTISGTPFLQDGLVFQLPGISLQIAPECSGIHSSLVLFITSLLAGYFFLRTPWKRALFILAVIPLAILRNGFRVYTIGELCVHIGPHMINSFIHRRGGPFFFALSLIPLFLLLRFLQKSERAGGTLKHRTAGKI